MNARIVKYNDKTYAVFGVRFNNTTLPVVLDFDDYKLIAKMGKVWKCNNYGSIYCSHTFDGVQKDVFMHYIIMNLKKTDTKAPILHINRINLDNRRDNIVHDTSDKNVNKNMKKKKRIIELPKNCGIDPNTLPTYVWYMNPDASHGDRFFVSIGDINWKTSSSKSVPLMEKLNQAKAYLNELKQTKPELFDDYSMNGDLNKIGNERLKEYYDIVHLADFKNVKKIIPNNTNKVLH